MGRPPKLNDEQKAEIVALRTSNPKKWTYEELSLRFGVTNPVINKVLKAAGLARTRKQIAEDRSKLNQKPKGTPLRTPPKKLSDFPLKNAQGNGNVPTYNILTEFDDDEW